MWNWEPSCWRGYHSGSLPQQIFHRALSELVTRNKLHHCKLYQYLWSGKICTDYKDTSSLGKEWRFDHIGSFVLEPFGYSSFFQQEVEDVSGFFEEMELIFMVDIDMFEWLNTEPWLINPRSSSCSCSWPISLRSPSGHWRLLKAWLLSWLPCWPQLPSFSSPTQSVI